MSRHFYDKLYLRARAMLNFIEDIMIQIRINKNYFSSSRRCDKRGLLKSDVSVKQQWLDTALGLRRETYTGLIATVNGEPIKFSAKEVLKVYKVCDVVDPVLY